MQLWTGPSVCCCRTVFSKLEDSIQRLQEDREDCGEVDDVD